MDPLEMYLGPTFLPAMPCQPTAIGQLWLSDDDDEEEESDVEKQEGTLPAHILSRERASLDTPGTREGLGTTVLV